LVVADIRSDDDHRAGRDINAAPEAVAAVVPDDASLGSTSS
jgi:hypothetical protein